MIQFDVKTIFLFYILGGLLSLTVFIYYTIIYKIKKFSMNLYIVAKFLQTISWVLFAEREIFHENLHIALGNALVFFGLAYEGFAIAITGKKFQKSKFLFVNALVSLGILIFIFTIPYGPNAWVISASFFIAVILGLASLELISQAKSNKVKGFSGFLYAILFFSFTYRGINALLINKNTVLLSSEFSQTALYVTIFIIIYLLPVLFLLVLKEHDYQNLIINEKRYRQVFETNTAMKLIIDPDNGAIVEANKPALDFYGYDLKTMTSMKIYDINIFLDKIVKKEMKFTKQEKKLYHQFKHRLASGEIRDVEVYSGPIKYQNKEYLFSIIHDITEKKQAEKELKRHKFTLDQIVDSVFIYKSTNLKFTYANQGASKQVGYSFEELLQMTPLDIKPQYTWKSFHDLTRPLLSGEKDSISFETFHRHKDGHDVPVHIILQYDNEHWIEGHFIAVVRDITEFKKTQEKLTQNEKFLNSVLNSSDDSIIVIGLDYKIITMNEHAKKNSLNYTNGKMPKFCYEAFHQRNSPCNEKEHLCPLDEVLRSKTSSSTIHIHQDEGGKEKYFDVLVSPIFNSEGKIEAIVESNRDITDLIHTEHKLSKTIKEKEMLIKEIHHRVKNNLTVIQSILSLQSSQSQDDAAIKALNESESRVRAMGMIHEKLYQSTDLSSIEFSDYVSNLVKQLYDNYCTNPENITVDIDIDKVHVDVDTIIPCGLIINEILTNMLKYAFPDGRKGKIEVKTEYDEIGQLFLILKDDGIGLPSEFDISKSKSLGMTLINSLSKQIGSEIQIHSKSDGSQFKINLQTARVTQLNWNDSHHLIGHKLIDEQHKALYDSVEKLKTMILAGKHEEGLQELIPSLLNYADEHFKTEEDIMIKNKYPEYEFHKNSHLEFKQNVNSLLEDIHSEKTGLSLSVYEFLANWLIEHVWHIDMELGIFLRERNIIDKVSIIKPRKKDLQVLIIEDDSVTQLILDRFMKNNNFSFIIVKNGKEAFNEIEKNNFELIISDVNLPDMNGIDIIRNIRNKGLKTKAIFLTGENINNVSDQLDMDNVIDILPKPISFQDLKKTLFNVLITKPPA